MSQLDHQINTKDERESMVSIFLYRAAYKYNRKSQELVAIENRLQKDMGFV